jgi:hypothetical protein
MLAIRTYSNFRDIILMKFISQMDDYDGLGLVVRVLGYRSRGPGSIPGTTRGKTEWVWNGVHSAS